MRQAPEADIKPGWWPVVVAGGSDGPEKIHRLRSEKSHEEAEGRGFDSPHLHDVLKVFPQVTRGVTCEAESQLTRI